MYLRSTVSEWPFQDNVKCQHPGAGTLMIDGYISPGSELAGHVDDTTGAVAPTG